jgi:hypothetical protein
MIITKQREIICMKKFNEPQRILVVGESGQGKSLFVNAISTRIFYNFGDKMGWLVDPTGQLFNISKPQDYSEFNKTNALLNNCPVPLPAIQLHLACSGRPIIENPNISFILAQNFEEFLRKYQFYTYGNDKFKLAGTVRYLQENISKLKNARSTEEFKKILYATIRNAHEDKGMQSMIYKWVSTFSTIFSRRFTSNMYQETEDVIINNELKNIRVIDELTLLDRETGKKKTGHPFITAMEAGVIPVLNIAVASGLGLEFLRNYLADLMQKIMNNQISYGNKFEDLFRRGRPNNIGFIGNTQSLTKLQKEMYDNATHIVCAYVKNPKDRRTIGTTFNLDKEIYEQLQDLKKQEVMIFSKEPFIVYDRWGRKKKVEERNWYRGKIIPPLNYHYAPGKVK